MPSITGVSSWLMNQSEPAATKQVIFLDTKEDNIMLENFNPNSPSASDNELVKEESSLHQELKFYKSRSSMFVKTTILLFIFNLVLSILLGISIKSKTNPTFLQDYLTNAFNHHSNDFMKFRNTLLSQTKVEIMNKDHNVLPIHSHNDYWRKTPLFDALRLGINSVEADVWYLPSTKDSATNLPELYVGHKRYKLSSYKTLKSLYFSNLEALLDDVNSKLPSDPTTNTNNSLNGIFYDDPEKTLYMVIDFKTDANDTLKVLESHLSAFIEKNYLTYYNTTSNKFHYGPITIIVSGNIPYELINQQTIRYTFIDAPLHYPNFEENFNNSTSIFSSSSLKSLTGSKSALGFNGLSEDQKLKLAQRFKIAHDLGIKVRVWDTPKWPITVRNSVWRDLLELGVDLLNADDIQGAVAF